VTADPSRRETQQAGRRHEGIDAARHTAAGHPADPNEGVLRATPPDGRALLVAALVALATIAALALLLAVR
jgi:hypothetical protein